MYWLPLNCTIPRIWASHHHHPVEFEPIWKSKMLTNTTSIGIYGSKSPKRADAPTDCRKLPAAPLLSPHPRADSFILYMFPTVSFLACFGHETAEIQSFYGDDEWSNSAAVPKVPLMLICKTPFIGFLTRYDTTLHIAPPLGKSLSHTYLYAHAPSPTVMSLRHFLYPYINTPTSCVSQSSPSSLRSLYQHPPPRVSLSHVRHPLDLYISTPFTCLSQSSLSVIP